MTSGRLQAERAGRGRRRSVAPIRVPLAVSVAVLLSSLRPDAALAAQDGVYFYTGRVLAGSPVESSWRVDVERELTGPIGVDAAVLALPGAAAGRTGGLYGVSAELTMFAAARGVPTVFVGVAGGIGTGGQSKLWAGGSFGLRMPFIVIGPVRLMAEGRWRTLSISGRNGIEAGVALGLRAKHRGPPRPESAGLWVPPPIADVLRARGIPETKAKLLGNVVTTALEEMGQPYVWGGTGNGSGGFDCSGLIQYAYGRYDIAIPRTAAGQSGAGIAMRRDQEALLPGDILVFSDRGDQPTHVGLYVGEGRFIHSASKTVRLSQLSEEDTEGRYWLHRWIGVRRIVE